MQKSDKSHIHNSSALQSIHIFPSRIIKQPPVILCTTIHPSIYKTNTGSPKSNTTNKLWTQEHRGIAKSFLPFISLGEKSFQTEHWVHQGLRAKLFKILHYLTALIAVSYCGDKITKDFPLPVHYHLIQTLWLIPYIARGHRFPDNSFV